MAGVSPFSRTGLVGTLLDEVIWRRGERGLSNGSSDSSSGVGMSRPRPSLLENELKADGPFGLLSGDSEPPCAGSMILLSRRRPSTVPSLFSPLIPELFFSGSGAAAHKSQSFEQKKKKKKSRCGGKGGRRGAALHLPEPDRWLAASSPS